MIQNGVSLEIDAGDLREKMAKLQQAMTPEQFKRATYGVFQRTGNHVKLVLSKDLPKKYEITAMKVRKTVQKPQVTMGGLGVGCVIPIRDKRGSIGKSGQYKATGSAAGWESLRKKYKVRARIVKGKRSVLPTTGHHGFKPFQNIPSKLNGIAFERTSKERGPIEKWSGIAVPQMPMNRSQQDVERDIHTYLADRLEQRYIALMRNGK